MKTRLLAVVSTLVVAGGLLGGGSALADDPAYSGTAVKTMTATLVDTTGAAIGTVQLHQDAKGVVLVRVDTAALPAGAHGVHIHAVGLCEGSAFTSAGGHFNPGGAQHGLQSPKGPHGGDLPQIPATFDGSDPYLATTDRISLTGGPNWIEDADGAALVIHAGADDQVTDPTGNSGARVACAVLAAPKPAAPAPATPKAPATGNGALNDSAAGPIGGTGVLALTGAVVALGVSVALWRRKSRRQE